MERNTVRHSENPYREKVLKNEEGSWDQPPPGSKNRPKGDEGRRADRRLGWTTLPVQSSTKPAGWWFWTPAETGRGRDAAADVGSGCCMNHQSRTGPVRPVQPVQPVQLVQLVQVPSEPAPGGARNQHSEDVQLQEPVGPSASSRRSCSSRTSKS